MSLLRRRNFTCFYCGSRSAQQQSGGVRQFKCEHCEADNYLDNNGHITEPPAPSTPTQVTSVRYAHVPPRESSPPPFPSSSSDIFCKSCLQNQHIVKENLAAYLPSEDSPRYTEYEASYETYRQKLEERYPQVCAKCAPRVRERIKQAGYIAKTDHLRRMMERTRTSGVASLRRGGWRGLLIIGGGLGWWTSGTAQMGWHALMAFQMVQKEFQKEESSITDDLDNTNAPNSEFYAHILPRFSPLSDELVTTISSWMSYILMVAILTIWWNSKMRRKYLYNGGRMVGLKDYYSTQLIILIARVIAFWALTDKNEPWFPEGALQAAHGFMAIFMLIAIPVSSNLVKLDETPRVSFTVENEWNFRPPSPDLATGSEVTPTAINRKLENHSFSVANFAPAPPRYEYQQAQHASYRPPTPPPEENYQDQDAMDWSPTSTSFSRLHNVFKPRSRVVPAQSFAGQSPFHGTIPPAPLPPAHRLRRPANLLPGAFQKASPQAKDNLFAAMNLSGTSTPDRSVTDSSSTSKFVESEDDDDYRSNSSRKGRVRKEINMARQRFFPTQDAIGTGLESMFDEVFTIRDTPKVVQKQDPEQMQTPTPFARTLRQTFSANVQSKKHEEVRGTRIFGSMAELDEQKHEQENVVRRQPRIHNVMMVMFSLIILGGAVVLVKSSPQQ